MIPQQTFESYPVFGDNATKVKPDDVKYAAGFQQADVLPAEWMNWAWAKNSKGITDANAGLSSVEAEIINVLTSRGKTPSASDNTQLLTVLNMIKAEAALAAHPVGSLYWTSSTENPATTFGGGTWTQIKDRFVLAAGDTYANGNTGGAATVTLTADQIPSHNHSFTPSGSISVTTNPTFTGSSHSHSYTPAGTVSKHTHSVGAHAHGLNSHTHSVGAHSHTINSGNTSSTGTKTTAGIRHSGNTGGMSANSTHSHSVYRYSTDSGSVASYISGGGSKDTKGQTAPYPGGKTDTKDLSHTHSMPASYIYGKTDDSTAFNTGAASGSTANSTAFNSGETQPTFTGTAATLTATQGGTISGGAYSFTGTAGNTGSKGGGGAHNNMPPYIVKYCWERVS
jgi:microcystin-dependent protein